MPAPAMLKAPRPAAAPRNTAARPTTPQQQRTAAAITYGRPDPIADSQVAKSNASVAQAMQAPPIPSELSPFDPEHMLRAGQNVAGNAAVAGFATQSMLMAGPSIRSGPPPLVVPPGPKPKGNPGLRERITGAIGGAFDWGMDHIVRPLRNLVSRAGSTLMRFKDMIVSDFTDANISGWDWLNFWHIPAKMFFVRWGKFSDKAVADERRQRAEAAAERGIPPDQVEPGPIERMDQAIDGMESMTEGVMGVQNEILEGAILGDFKEDPSVWNTVGQIAMGFVPYAGQVADARDTVAIIIKLSKGGWKDPFEWINLVLTLIAWVPGVGDLIKGVGKGVLKAIRGGGGDFLKKGRKLWAGMFKQGAKLLDKAKKFGKTLLKGIRNLGGHLVRWMDNLGRTLTRAVDDIATRVRGVVDGVFQRVDGVITTIRSKADEHLRSAEDLLRRVPGAVRHLVDRAMNALRSGIDEVLGLVRRTVEAGRRLMMRLLNAITDMIRKARDAVIDAAKWAVRTAKDMIDRAVTAAREALAAGRRLASDLWNRGKAALRELTEKAKHFIKDKVIKFVRDLWRRVKSRFVNFFKRKWEQLKRKLFGEDPKKPKKASPGEAVELSAAMVQARAIAVANDALNTPVSAVIAQLMTLRRRYRWIERFEARLEGPDTYSLWLIASRHQFYRRYTSKDERTRARRPEEGVEIAGVRVRGFRNASELMERVGNLRNRIGRVRMPDGSYLEDVTIGIRGSAVTGVSSKGGEFRHQSGELKASDVDFFFTSPQFERALQRLLRTVPRDEVFKGGLMRPEAMERYFPGLYDAVLRFERQTTQQIGRHASVRFLLDDFVRSLEEGSYVIFRR